MYIYSLYGFKLYSQIPLFFLPVYSTQPDPNGELYLEYIQMEIAEASWDITFSRESDEYTLRMGASITYRIHAKEKRITAYASNVECVESTLLNLPFAAFATTQHALLLHASSLAYNNTLIPLFATKGTGKTTLSAALSIFFPFFSDDTLYVKLAQGVVEPFAGSRLMKAHDDSANTLNLRPVCNKRNLQNKGFYRPFLAIDKEENLYTNFQLNAFFFLFRKKCDSIETEEIISPTLKFLSLHSNICGVETLGFDYCKGVESSAVFLHLLSSSRFYKIYIPDQLSLLSKTAEELSDKINMWRYFLPCSSRT